jgi:hypothetical protein
MVRCAHRGVLYKAMDIRLVIAVGTVWSLPSFPAFADEACTCTTTGPPRIGAQAQIELLTQGSSTYTLAADPPLTVDLATAYAISGVLDYAFTSFLRVGVAPRLILAIKEDGFATAPTNKAVDVRVRIRAHYAISGLEFYAAFTPGYEVLLLDADRDHPYDGWSLGGSVGATYDLSSAMFIGGEIGYQVAYNSAAPRDEWRLSYAHIGLGAGTRF